MRFSKLRVVSVGLLLMILVGSLAISAGEEKSKRNMYVLTCTSTIKVVGGKHGVEPVDIYACPKVPVTWDANGHTFKVVFKRECPFEDSDSCKHIDQGSPTSSSKVKDLDELQVFDYGILVGDDFYDPHVVGGGHHSP